jgi:hypothetical protein
MSGRNTKAQLAADFNAFYLATTLPDLAQVGNYRITLDLGEGAFGKVYLAQHVLLNVPVVLKCGPKDDPNIVREIYYHRQLRHKHIVKLYEVIKTELHLWMALEYCEGNELYFHIYHSRRLDYRQCQHLFYQIVLAVRHVHLLNLCHRDLKLENILLADARKTVVKLTDFGFVREYSATARLLLSTVCGTTVYMAPEMLAGQRYLGFACDVWLMGVILYTMLYGELPFDEDDDMANRYKIMYEEPVMREIVPKDAIELLRRMLAKDPKRRADLDEVLALAFLRGVHQKAAAKLRRRSGDSILSMSQHYEQQQQNGLIYHMQPGLPPPPPPRPPPPPQPPGKVERGLLKALRKLNIDVDQLERDVLANKTDTLTAFYELALTREYKRKKQRYNQERRQRYHEAKRSLRSSKQRVKSVLSLTDQAQPLEKILSSLSISRTEARLIKERDVAAPAHSPLIASVSMGTRPAAPRVVSFNPGPPPPPPPPPADSRKKRLLGKLQFWKRGDDDDELASLGNTLSNTTAASASPEKPDAASLHTAVSHTSDAAATPARDDAKPTALSTPQALSTSALGASHDTTPGRARGRPASMVSQVSQLSHLSQLSTMMSESEMDNLGETDTMDEDDFYDEDGMYELSVSNSHLDLKAAAALAGHPSSARGASSGRATGAPFCRTCRFSCRAPATRSCTRRPSARCACRRCR